MNQTFVTSNYMRDLNAGLDKADGLPNVKTTSHASSTAASCAHWFKSASNPSMVKTNFLQEMLVHYIFSVDFPILASETLSKNFLSHLFNLSKGQNRSHGLSALCTFARLY